LIEINNVFELQTVCALLNCGAGYCVITFSGECYFCNCCLK